MSSPPLSFNWGELFILLDRLPFESLAFSTMSAEYVYAPRPPPPAGVLSAVRRQYDHQPAVTVSTSLGAAHRQPAHLGSNHTPSTASSTRSSPFVGYGSPAFAASPDVTSSHASPVGSNGSSFAYDPSQWAPNVSHQPLAATPAARNTVVNGYSATAPGLCMCCGLPYESLSILSESLAACQLNELLT